jgi:Flp pilus assembly protein TadD
VQLNEWEGAAADCAKAVQLDPGPWQSWSDLAEAEAQLGRKEQAVRSFVNAIDRGGNSPGLWYKLAVLQADAGDQGAYRKTCAAMLGRFGKANDPETVYLVAMACATEDGAVLDLRGLVDSMRHAADTGRNTRYPGGLGHLLYRTGDAAGAVKTLDETIKLRKDDGDPWEWLVLALAHARLGHKDEAGRWLEKSAAWLDGPVGKGRSWNDRLHLELLRREATEKTGKGP